MAHQCTICYNEFTWDPSAKDKSHLPVQSRVCSHVLCYTCMLSIYQAAQPDDGSMIKLDCPECRKKGAHDPLVPIISLPICDLLAERNCMVKHNPNLEQVSEEVRKQMLEQRRQERERAERNPTELLAQAALENMEWLTKTVQEKLTIERPLLKLTKEASRAIYWGSILVFGAIDRNESRIVEQESVERIWNKVTEKLEIPSQF